MKTFIHSLSLVIALGSLTGISAEKTSVHGRVAAGVAAIRLIDTHEHISAEADRLKKTPTLFSLLHYVSSDMWADGLERGASERILDDGSIPLEKKWELIAPYWANVRTTAYGRSLLRAIRDLYGIDDISEATYHEISRKIRDSNRPGWYDAVLKKKAGIDLSICDVGSAGADLDPAFFRAVIRLDYFLVYPEGARIAEGDLGVSINSLSDWEEALQKSVANAKAKKFVAIKSAIAYQRSLDFAPVERSEAEKLFNQARELRGKTGMADWSRNKPLQDYMFGKLADACAQHDLPLQIHTGIFYDPWRNVAQSNPSLLIPLIARHRQTRFVLMHAGYPYGSELLALAKNLPNVTIDMCWAYIISPTFAARFLDEAIETIPADKILAFGGDYQIPEGAYAHAMLCREVVSRVLADKVAGGYWSEEEALKFARAILRENAIKVFKLRL